MKKIVKYECEICSNKYDTEEEAVDCEARGKFDPSNYPIGLMDEYEHNGYVGIFAIAKSELYYNNSHLGTASMWAFRTKGYPPESIDDNLCGGSHLLKNKDVSIYFNISKEGIKKPEFQKMVEYLKSKSITPQYYERETGNLIIL